jgi:hypothetical protein
MGDNWDEVTVLRKKAPSGAGSKKTSAVNAAMRTGSVTTTAKVYPQSSSIILIRE